MSGFPLADGCPINGHALRRDILDREADDITASELAVDGEIEHCQVSNATFDLEFGPYRPDIFWFGAVASNRSVFPYSMGSDASFRDHLQSVFAWSSPLLQRPISMLRLSWTAVVGPVSAQSGRLQRHREKHLVAF